MRALGIATAAVVALFGLGGTASATTLSYVGHLHYNWDGSDGPGAGGVTSSHADYTVLLDENGKVIGASGSSTETFGSGSSAGSFTLTNGGLLFYDFGANNGNGDFDDGTGPGPFDINFNTAGPYDSTGVSGDVRLIVWTPSAATYLTQDHLSQVGDPGQGNQNTPYAYLSFGTNNAGTTHHTSGLTYEYTVQAVPEPASASLALVGLGAAAGVVRRRRRARA